MNAPIPHRPTVNAPLLRRSALCLAVLLAACGGGGGSGPAAPPPSGGGGGGGDGGSSGGPEVVVQVAPGASIDTIAAGAGLTVLDQFGRRPIWRLQLPAGGDPVAVAAALQQRSDVRFAEANVEQETPEGSKNSVWVIGGDAQAYAAQWAPQALRLPAAHAAVGTGAGVRVAVLDTGIDASHPALADRLARRADGRVLGRDFVDDDADPSEDGSRADAGFGHGTHVAGLVALAAPGAAIMPLRVLDRGGRGNAWVLAEALAWAVDPDGDPSTDDGAHVINLSLGTTRPTRLLSTVVGLASCEFDDDDDDDLDDPGFDDDRVRCARGHGAVVLAAAGNDGSDQVQIFPAAEGVEGLRAVAATTEQSRLAAFSNSGGWIKLAAPGEAIIGPVPGGAWGTWSGTSMAAPLAAGSAALLLATPAPNPRPGTTVLRRWAAEDILKRLEDRAAPVCGASLKAIDAAAAVTDTPAPDPACP